MCVYCKCANHTENFLPPCAFVVRVLPRYAPAFADASVDGDFLLELREEDLAVVLGMEHKLHVRKVKPKSKHHRITTMTMYH